jgi:hypothetical protein
MERDPGGDLTNVQYNSIWNFHNDSPLFNQYILILKKAGEKSNSFTMKSCSYFVDYMSIQAPNTFTMEVTFP